MANEYDPENSIARLNMRNGFGIYDYYTYKELDGKLILIEETHTDSAWGELIITNNERRNDERREI
jgi:hypothetical protein